MKKILWFGLLLALTACAGKDQAIRASGFIEAHEIVMATGVGGRVVDLHSEGGDLVEQGQALLQLDDTDAHSAIIAAEAARAAAEAEVARLESQPSESEIAALEAERVAAQNQLVSAENLVELLKGGSSRALAQARLAEAIAQKQLDLAEANLRALQSGPPSGQIDIARAQLREAEAWLHALEIQQGWYALEAPFTGVVGEVFASQDEVAAPGAPLLKLLDLQNLRLTVFLTESERAKVERDDLVLISVDAYPAEAFPGIVDKISPQAEFTPSDVQISEQRVRTVFRVVVVFTDFGGKLRPGMSAEAEFMP